MTESAPLSLRFARVENARELLPLLQPERLKNFSFFNEAPTLDRERAYLRRMTESTSDRLFIVETTEESHIVGTAGLHEIDFVNKNARLGMMIFCEEDQGRGYARSALDLVLRYGFRELDLNKVYCTPFASNDHSVRVWEHLGFRFEGCLRQEYQRHGEYFDLIRMAILREEWQTTQGRSV